MKEMYLAGCPTSAVRFYPNQAKRTENDVSELAADIKVNGLINHPTARLWVDGKLATEAQFDGMNGDGVMGAQEFEIGPGQTRVLATKEIGWEAINLRIVFCDDTEFEGLMFAENIKRKDMHPLDVATYIAAALEKGEKLPKLAKRLSMPLPWLKKMQGLSELSSATRERFRTNEINIEQAIVLATLDADWQAAFLAKNIKETPIGKVLLLSPKKILDSFHEGLNTLKIAKFDTKDGKLVPEAGPCFTCKKRSDDDGNLFGQWMGEKIKTDWSGPRCLDSACFANKTAIAQKAAFEAAVLKFKPQETFGLLVPNYSSAKPDTDHVKAKAIWNEVYGQGKKCDSIVIGVNAMSGDPIIYCTNPLCAMHQRYSQRENPKEPQVQDPMPGDEARRKFEKQKKINNGVIESKARRAYFEACIQLRNADSSIGLSDGAVKSILDSWFAAKFKEFIEVFKVMLANEKFEGPKQYGYYHSDKESFTKKILADDHDEAEPWLVWIRGLVWMNPVWVLMATTTAEAWMSSDHKLLPAVGKALWDLDSEPIRAGSEALENVKMEAKRLEVERLEAKDKALIEVIFTLLDAPADILQQDETHELFVKMIHDVTMIADTENDLIAVVKFMGGAVRKTTPKESLPTMYDDLMKVWRRRKADAEK